MMNDVPEVVTDNVHQTLFGSTKENKVVVEELFIVKRRTQMGECL